MTTRGVDQAKIASKEISSPGGREKYRQICRLDGYQPKSCSTCSARHDRRHPHHRLTLADVESGGLTSYCAMSVVSEGM